MALTATATKETRKAISRSLGLKKPVIVSQSPNNPHMFYKVNSTTNIIEDAFTPLLEEIRCKRTTMDRTIIFCRSYDSCTYMYHFFRSRLGREMSEPQGYLNYCELRLVDMFTACTHPDVKNILHKQFRNPTSCLRVVIVTIAFGMGIDCPNVRRVIHWGSPQDIESYMQETGRAGRDGLSSTAELFCSVQDSIKFTDDKMKDYCKLKSGQCRRLYLLQEFDHIVKTVDCKCCDLCATKCVCELCIV